MERYFLLFSKLLLLSSFLSAAEHLYPQTTETPYFTWDLTTSSYSLSSDTTVIWTSNCATMKITKGDSGYKANYKLGGDYSYTELYRGFFVYFSPVNAVRITKINVTTSSENYARTWSSWTWNNAKVNNSGQTVEIIPNDGLKEISAQVLEATKVKQVTVYYDIPMNFSIGSMKWATYFTDKAFTMPEGVVGVTVFGNEDGILTLNQEYTSGTVVPANTPLLVNGAEGTYSFYSTSDTVASSGTNYLRGQLTAGEITPEKDGEYYYYKLAVGTDATTGNIGKLGFYWGAENGGVFTLNNDNRAYLVLPQSDAENAKEVMLDFDNFTDDIERTAYESVNSEMHNIVGQKIKNPIKGQIYIMNGKKYVGK